MVITTATGDRINIDRPTGRAVNPDVWVMPDGQLRSLGRYAIGWRMDAVYYDDSGVRAVGAYRPENVKGSPFHPAWGTCAPEAACSLGLADIVSNPLRMMSSHSHPHPDCTWGTDSWRRSGRSRHSSGHGVRSTPSRLTSTRNLSRWRCASRPSSD